MGGKARQAGLPKKERSQLARDAINKRWRQWHEKPEKERERYLSRVRFEQRTETTVKSLSELRRHLAKVVREGVAYSHGEHIPGVVAIAAAVRRPDAYPIGAINVVIPAIRFNASVEASCLRELLTARSALERELHAGF